MTSIPSLLPAVAALALLAAVPVSAQQPDTTAPWRYYPLAVGNVWEYEARPSSVEPPAFVRRVVERDTVVDGRRYFVQVTYVAAGRDAPFVYQSRSVVRFDTTAARVVGLIVGQGPGGEYVVACGLGAAFETNIDCSPMNNPNGGPDETQVSGGYGGTVDFGPGTGPLPVEARKSFREGFGDGGNDLYAAPVGYVGNSGAFCEGCFTALRYARVGGVSYGVSVVVAAEPGPDAPEVSLSVLPNPSLGPVVVRLSLGETTRSATVMVLDALGREVMVLLDGTARAGEWSALVDTGSWPAGVYVVRATLGGRVASARLVVAR